MVDYNLANQAGAAFRTELNNILDAAVKNNASATEPTSTFVYMPWVDLAGAFPVFKIRNAANDGWITVAVLNGNTWEPAGTTAFTRTLLDDADAAAARTTLGLSNTATRDYGWEIIDEQDLATSTADFTSFDPATYSRYRISYENIGSDGVSEYSLFKWGAENNAGANNLWTGKFTDWAGSPPSYPATVEVEQQLNGADLFDYIQFGREGGSLSLTFEINDMPYSTISAPTIQLDGYDRKGWITADTNGQMSSFGISNFTLFGTGVGTAPTTATGLIGKRFVEAWRK